MLFAPEWASASKPGADGCASPSNPSPLLLQNILAAESLENPLTAPLISGLHGLGKISPQATSSPWGELHAGIFGEG